MDTKNIKGKIKTYSAKFWELTKRRKILSSIIALILILTGGYFVFGKSSGPLYNTVLAKRGTVIQEVSVTGRVKPAQDVDLAFENTGKIANIYVDVRSKVISGQILASLSNEDIQAQLLQAQAGVQSAQANLDELKKGSRPEDIAIAQSQLLKAQQDLDNYYSGAIDVLNDAYTKANDAIRNQTDGIILNGETNSPSLSFSSSDVQAQINTQQQRISASGALNEWSAELNALKSNPTNDQVDRTLTNSEQWISTIKSFLNSLMDATQNAIGVSSTTISTYKSNINTGKVEVDSAATNISNQEQSIASQKFTVETAQNQLNLKIAGSTPEQIAAQEAAVKEAQANVQNYEAQLEKTIIRAPFNGTITRQDGKVGQITNQNDSLISMMSNSKFQVEADVPEVDIPKVKIGDTTDITLDAYGNDVVFKAIVIKIDPAETLIEGVATYKVTLEFTDANDMIKPGMTANLDILTDKKDNVIYLPQRAVKTDGQKTVILLNKDNTTKEVVVETGLKGSDGNVEITSGVNEGDIVVTSTQ